MPESVEVGVCRICRKTVPLTREHVPPQAAFNDGSLVVIPGDRPVEFDTNSRGTIIQGGRRFRTLCGKCNNDTGAWYGGAYVNWAYDGMRHLLGSGNEPDVLRINHGFPLRIIKQIIVGFLAINNDNFSRINCELRHFVLAKRRIGLSSRYGIWGYYTGSPIARYEQLSNKCERPAFKQYYFSEYSFPPFGYILTVDSPPPDRRLFDLSWLARFRYEDQREFQTELRSLEINIGFPADFRTHSEIETEYHEALKATPIDPDENPELTEELRHHLTASIEGLADRGG